MKTYICILRGINVSGKNIIKMDALKHSFGKLGFQEVISYIQSGNIVFRFNDEDPDKLAGRIKTQVQNDFSCDVPVQVYSIDEFSQIIKANPFAEDSTKDDNYLHVTFLAKPPKELNEEAILSKKTGDEEIVISEAAVYLYCPNGYGRTKLNNNFLEKKLKVASTTRNWKTTLNLLEIAASNELREISR